jgi:hypothetical protein
MKGNVVVAQVDKFWLATVESYGSGDSKWPEGRVEVDGDA